MTQPLIIPPPPEDWDGKWESAYSSGYFVGSEVSAAAMVRALEGETRWRGKFTSLAGKVAQVCDLALTSLNFLNRIEPPKTIEHRAAVQRMKEIIRDAEMEAKT